MKHASDNMAIYIIPSSKTSNQTWQWKTIGFTNSNLYSQPFLGDVQLPCLITGGYIPLYIYIYHPIKYYKTYYYYHYDYHYYHITIIIIIIINNIYICVCVSVYIYIYLIFPRKKSKL